MATANDIIKLLEKEVGIKESPANSNNVKYNTAYYGRKVSGSEYPWCCVFVWWIFNQAGASTAAKKLLLVKRYIIIIKNRTNR